MNYIPTERWGKGEVGCGEYVAISVFLQW